MFQKLKPTTLGQGVIQTVQGGGLHFSSSVSEMKPPTLGQSLIQKTQDVVYVFLAVFQNIGSGFDSNSAGGRNTIFQHCFRKGNLQHWVRK